MPKRLPIVNSEDLVLLDDDVAGALVSWRRRIYRTSVGHRRPVFYKPGIQRSGTWRRKIPIAHWINGGFQTGMFAKHINGDVLDCRRENLVPVRTRGEAGSIPGEEGTPSWDTLGLLAWPL